MMILRLSSPAVRRARVDRLRAYSAAGLTYPQLLSDASAALEELDRIALDAENLRIEKAQVWDKLTAPAPTKAPLLAIVAWGAIFVLWLAAISVFSKALLPWHP
jgi:hypothetical protein